MGLHIARYQELPKVGHWAYGVSFPYPPYYYYFLGFLSSISTDLFFIFTVFIIIQLIGIVALYQIGTLLYNRLVGLLAGLFYALSAIMVIAGSMIETVFFNVPVFLLSFWSFVEFYKSKKIRFAILSILLILLSASIHASSLPFLFLYILLAVFRLGKKKVFQIFLLFTFTLFLTIVFYFPLIRYYSLHGFILELTKTDTGITGNNVFLAFLASLGKPLRLLFFSQLNSIIYFIV